MTGRPYTRADYLAIKSATRRACEDAGPLHEIATNTRSDPAQLSRYGNPERNEFIPLDVAMDLDALSGGDRILRAWAELRGYDLVRDEKGVAVEDMTRHIGAVGVESGELISEMCNAIADAKITPREAEAIERRAEDVLDNVRLLQSDMRRVRAV
ncbi:phage regulatory CII family protein [Tardiphaga sp. 839_C3_N1_4]|jgi:hypothetical protein|uniref:phage regulatory CII family protein n=1 Tax=Tardiphaga sp. 839_C3_N1_4 TaxID=3240761 RepID=UPI003F1F5B96